jgi:RimJ/RimL family protein N-acetyltransferase
VITTMHQPILARWLCERIGLTPTPHLRCIGSVRADGTDIMGVVGFDGYNGASVQMHVAGTPHWISPAVLHAAFDYPFNHLGCNVVFGSVPSGNAEALRFNTKLGFTILAEVPGAHPDGSLILMALRREDCKWLAPRRTH